MQNTTRTRQTQPLVTALLTLALLMTGYCARAQTPLAPETVLVAASGAPAPTQETFKIAGSTDLTVTFTDLQTPAALSAASVAVTQGASLVSMTSLAAGATTATLSLHAAVGQYTLRVIATPNASATLPAGSFGVCVAPTATPKACIADASITGSVAAQSSAANPTLSTQSLTLTVVTAGSYTFTYADVQFPVALHVPPTLALFQGSTAIAVPIPASPAAITLAAGTYTLLAFAQADPVAQAGLYGIVVSGPALVAPLVNSIYPVGLLAPASPASNPSTQSVALTVTDLAFPTALTGARAVITEGGTVLGSASAGAGALGSAALLSLTLLEPARVVGTDIAFGFLISLVGSGLHLGSLGSSGPLLTHLIIGGVAGAIGGTLLSTHIPRRPLKLALWVWLLFLGGQFLFNSYHVWAVPHRVAATVARQR